jgi:predicted transposase YdaD
MGGGAKAQRWEPMIENPHDAFFKMVFSQPEHAAGELRAVLRPELVQRIVWDTLTLCPGSFIDAALARSYTDLLFSVILDGSRAFLYFLVEHQSTPVVLIHG